MKSAAPALKKGCLAEFPGNGFSGSGSCRLRDYGGETCRGNVAIALRANTSATGAAWEEFPAYISCPDLRWTGGNVRTSDVPIATLFPVTPCPAGELSGVQRILRNVWTAERRHLGMLTLTVRAGPICGGKLDHICIVHGIEIVRQSPQLRLRVH